MPTAHILTFVAIDENLRPVPSPAVVPETRDEERRFAEALLRRENRFASPCVHQQGLTLQCTHPPVFSLTALSSCSLTIGLVFLLSTDSRAQMSGPLGVVTFGTLPPRTTMHTMVAFNRDNIPDLLFYNQALSAVQVMIGNGDGTFRSPQSICSVSDVTYLAAADLNADSIPDIIIVHRDANELEVLLSSVGVPVYSSKIYSCQLLSGAGGARRSQ